jgi:hypothetical protein
MRSFSWKNFLIVSVLVAGAFALGRITAAKYSSAAGPHESAVVAGSSNTKPANAAAVKPGDNLKSTSGQSVDQVRAALSRLDQTTPSELREDERFKLLLAWAATDPVGAMAYAKENLKRDRLAQAMAGIATEWAKHDPAAAWGWARSLGPEETYHAHTVMEEIGKNDPAMAARLATEFAQKQPDEAVAMCLTAMRAMTYNGNFDAARKLATEVQLRSPEEQAMLLNFMAGQWAHFEPDQTAQWVKTLPEGAAREQALIGLGESWAEVDPPKAADFAVALPPGPLRQTALRQAIGNWIHTDPEKASTWINQFEPHEDFDQAVASVATMRFLMEEHVDLALNWAGTIASEPLREATLDEIVSNWYVHDHAAALNYIQTATGLSPEARDRLQHQLKAGAE